MVCRVITDISLDREFDYLVPEEWKESLTVGMAVDVPFGKTMRNGYVVATNVTSSVAQEKLKPLSGIKNASCHILCCCYFYIQMHQAFFLAGRDFSIFQQDIYSVQKTLISLKFQIKLNGNI